MNRLLTPALSSIEEEREKRVAQEGNWNLLTSVATRRKSKSGGDEEVVFLIEAWMNLDGEGGGFEVGEDFGEGEGQVVHDEGRVEEGVAEFHGGVEGS